MYRVLVIDDEPSICKALTIGLTATDMEVHSAADGGSGVKRGCTEKFDVYIVDLDLPDMNGLDVIREVKKCTTESVYILITAHHYLYNATDSNSIGLNGFLEKPLDMKSVESAIRNGLDRRRSIIETG